jgi:tetratricopeptide (TPR) repeat protein
MEKYPDYAAKYMLYSHIGDLYFRMRDYDKALDAYESAMENSSDIADKALCLSEIASIHREMGDFGKVENIYGDILEMPISEQYLSKIHFNFGSMFFDANSMTKAFDAFRNALKYRESSPIFKDNNDYIMDIWWYLGTSAYHNEDYDRTIEYLNKTLSERRKEDSYYCNANITLAHAYLARGNYKLAGKYYTLALLAPLASEDEKKMAAECLQEVASRGSKLQVLFYRIFYGVVSRWRGHAG